MPQIHGAFLLKSVLMLCKSLIGTGGNPKYIFSDELNPKMVTFNNKINKSYG